MKTDITITKKGQITKFLVDIIILLSNKLLNKKKANKQKKI